MTGVALAFSRAARRPLTAEPRALRDDRHLRLIGAAIWVLVALMIVPDGFDYSDLTTASGPASGGLVSRLLWFALLSVGLILIFRRAAVAWPLARSMNPFLFVFVALAAISIGWSDSPSVTARRLIRILAIVTDSIAFALIGWHALRFQTVLRPILTAVLLGSIVFGLGWPALAIHPETSGVLAGAWRGLTSHKNGLGDIACIGLIFWFHAWLSRQARPLPALLGGSIAVACLVLSRSSTSLVAAAFTMLFLTMLLRSPQGLRRYMPYLVALFIAALLAYSLALLHFVPGLDLLLSPITMLTGKDLTFTGRTDIWDIMSEHIRLHPYLGNGYGAFWTGSLESSPSYEFVQRLYFYPASAHNGYLDILNDLGAGGLFVLFAYLATYITQSLRLLGADRIQASLYLALFLQQAITNLSESRWFNALSVDFAIMTLATAALARTLFDHRLRRSSGASHQDIAGHARPNGMHGDPAPAAV